MGVLERSGAAEQIGKDNIFGSVLGAIYIYLKREGKATNAVIHMMSDVLNSIDDLVERAKSGADIEEQVILEALHRELTDSVSSLEELNVLRDTSPEQ